jgi:predicted nucleic acid-binding Zn ribbon protein
VRQFLEDRGWEAGDQYSPLFAGWKQVVGEPLAGHSRLAEVEDGVLIVDVDHPGWLQLLSMRKQAVLQAARKAAPRARIEGVRGRIAR